MNFDINDWLKNNNASAINGESTGLTQEQIADKNTVDSKTYGTK